MKAHSGPKNVVHVFEKTIYLKLKQQEPSVLQKYGHFGYMVNFWKTKPCTIYSEPSVQMQCSWWTIPSPDSSVDCDWRNRMFSSPKLVENLRKIQGFFARESFGRKWWTMVSDYLEGAKIRQCFLARWPTQNNYVPPLEEEQRQETSKGITDDDRREQEWRKVRRPVGCWIWSLQS